MTTTHTITVAEALAFKGCLSQLAADVAANELAASAAYEACAAIIHNAIATQHAGVNYGAFSSRERRHADTVTLEATVALAGAAACRKVSGAGDEWPAVARILAA